MGSEGGGRKEGGWSGGGVGSSLCPHFVSSLSCCRPILLSCCRCTSLLHVAVTYNRQQRTMTNVIICCLVGPFAAIMFAVVHHRLVVIMLWYCVLWSHFSSEVCCGCVHKIYHNDKQ